MMESLSLLDHCPPAMPAVDEAHWHLQGPRLPNIARWAN